MAKTIKRNIDVIIVAGIGLFLLIGAMMGVYEKISVDYVSAATTADVTVSATVAESLEIWITGLATSTSINGTTTTMQPATDGTAIAFGTLTVGEVKIAGQKIEVTTNAANGFSVTVKQDHNLSTSTLDIDSFKDGVASTTPVAWTSPAATSGQENTYGHFGFISDDSDIDYPFSSNTWVGFDGTNTFEVMATSTGPVEKTDAEGHNQVAYAIEISGLQEAGTYGNTLTYTGTGSY